MRRLETINILKFFRPSYWLLIVCFLLFTFFVSSAQGWVMPVDGKALAGGQKTAGAVITLFKNGQQIQQVVTTSNGKFSFELPPNAEYIIAITKPGFVTKKFKIVTANVPADRAENGNFNPFEPDVTLFEMPTSPEIAKRVEAILSQPIAIYQYIPAENNFNYDEKYTQSIQQKLSELADLQKQVEKEMQEKAKNAAMEAQKQLETDNKYKAAIAKGDKALAAADYVTAKAGYNEAIGVKPQEAYPKQKLAEIDKLMASANAQKEIDEKYKAAIAKADGSFNAKDYPAAKTAYTEASGIKPAEGYPKQRISEIDKLLGDLARQKELDEKYKTAIAKADGAFGAKDYASAKTAYTEASGVKPSEAYPKTKLAEIDKLLAEAGKQKEIDEKYKAALAKGDGAFASKDYASAKTAYTEASGLKPAEAYPKTKLAEIDKLMGDQAKQKEIDAKYQAAIAKGDGSFGTKDYAAAKTAYTEASGIKPGEAYPKTKLAEIDKLLAAADAAAKQKEVDEKYKAAIVKGDAAFSSKDFASARTAYTDALGLKPTEAYPKIKLAEIAKQLGDAASAAAKQKEMDDKYKAAVSRGDAAFGTKEYASAKAAYNEALGIKPAEEYPQTKIDEIDKLMAAQAQEGTLDKQYKELIAKGDELFAQKSYEESKAAYTQASALKYAELYPKNRIAEINKILKALAAQKSVNDIEQKYKEALARGDKALGVKDYAAARLGYTDALGVKPNEAYPKTKLEEIEKLIAEAAAKKELDDKYKAALAGGDKAFGIKDYTAAQTSYTAASSLKPTELYPKQKLAEIDKLLAAKEVNNQKDQRYNELIAKGDQQFNSKEYANAKSFYSQALAVKSDPYPRQKLSEIEQLLKNMEQEAAKKELEKNYQAAIARGDAAFKENSFSNAKVAYNEALTYKPGEPYPKDKLAEIEAIEKVRATAEASNETLLKYKQCIERADKAFGIKDYMRAKPAYEEALSYRPAEKHPKQRLAQIEAIQKAALTSQQNIPKEPKPKVPVVTEEEKKKVYQSELRSKYPTGVTEEEYSENGKVILRRIVIKEDFAGIYTKVTHNWGGIYCFKDNVPITEMMFENESR